jgi:hypothetical protein
MADKEKKDIKVTDKRKFDADGNLREEASTTDEEVSEQEEFESSDVSGGSVGGSHSQEAGGADVGDMPVKIDFSTFIMSLGSQTLMAMGVIPDPISQKAQQNLPAAQQLIDILQMLREKTKNNLEAGEITMFENLLYDLRMNYVHILEQAKKEK